GPSARSTSSRKAGSDTCRVRLLKIKLNDGGCPGSSFSSSRRARPDSVSAGMSGGSSGPPTLISHNDAHSVSTDSASTVQRARYTSRPQRASRAPLSRAAGVRGMLIAQRPSGRARPARPQTPGGERVGIPAGRVRGVPHGAPEARAVAHGAERAHDPAVGQLAGAAQRALGMAADIERNARGRADGRLLETEELALVVDRLAGEQPPDHRHALPKYRDTTVHRHRDGRVLFRPNAEPNAQRHSS